MEFVSEGNCEPSHGRVFNNTPLFLGGSCNRIKFVKGKTSYSTQLLYSAVAFHFSKIVLYLYQRQIQFAARNSILRIYGCTKLRAPPT